MIKFSPLYKDSFRPQNFTSLKYGWWLVTVNLNTQKAKAGRSLQKASQGYIVSTTASTKNKLTKQQYQKKHKNMTSFLA